MKKTNGIYFIRPDLLLSILSIRAFSKIKFILFSVILLAYHSTSYGQVELIIDNDSISIENTALGIPHVGLGLSGLNISSGFSESLLTPFEFRIIQTPLLPFFGSTRLEYNSLKFEFSDVALYDLDWDITQLNDPLNLQIGYKYTTYPGGIPFSYSPITIAADTANLKSYIYLQDRIGIDVDTVRESRITVFTEEDEYTNDAIGAIQVYKNTEINGAAISGIGSSTGDDKGVAITSGTLAGYGPIGNVGVYGHAIDTMMAGVIGGNGGDHYVPDRWAALGTGQYAVYANGAQFSTSNTLWSTSDKHLKKQIKSHVNILDKVLELKPRQYYYSDNEKFKNLSFPEELQHGFLAQEVEKLFPELVSDVALLGLSKETVNNIYKAINYNGFIGILTTAIQESHQQVVAQHKLITHLEKSHKKQQNEITQLKNALTQIIEKNKN